MKTIWVIEDGSYSDYRVVGVFSTREAAEVVHKALKGDSSYYSGEINEWPLNPAVAELNAGMSQWLVHMLKNGDTERVEKLEMARYDIQGEVRVWERTQAPAYRGKGVPDIINATVWATDKDHALKIVNEHRLRMIASGEFK